jgi:apolipoprotein N-acyltransferase
MSDLPADPTAPREATMMARLAAAFLTWGMLYLAMPGLGRPGGFGHMAFVALIPWGLVCSRPGKRAFLIEWLAATLGFAAIFHWLGYVIPFVSLPVGALMGLHFALAGVALRRLARRFPLALAVPAAWMLGELTRWTLPQPFSMGWFKLGDMAHDTGWMIGSARIWGGWGLTLVFAAWGGWWADWWRIHKATEDAPYPHRAKLCHAIGLTPFALSVALSLGTSPPQTEAGPKVLLIQPGIEQVRKQQASEPFKDVFGDTCELLRNALLVLRTRGLPDPDLVCLGETMLPYPAVADDLMDGWDAGARPQSWTEYAGWSREQFANLHLWEELQVQGVMFGQPLPTELAWRVRDAAASGQMWAAMVLRGRPLLPPGTSFFSGVEQFVAVGDEVRRSNAVFIWDANGVRSEAGGKIQLVPGAEALYGLENVSVIADGVRKVGGYVPDLVALPEAVVLPLTGRKGGKWQVATSVCFDNTFDGPYTAPVRRTAVDFHLVASNEAWYLDSQEMDHMVALSRVRAVETGRAVVRAANSGVSCVIGPDGKDVKILEVEGVRKMVRGWTISDVPVPVRAADGSAPKTPFVRLEGFWIGFWWLFALGLLAIAGRGPVTSSGGRVDAPSGGA